MVGLLTTPSRSSVRPLLGCGGDVRFRAGVDVVVRPISVFEKVCHEGAMSTELEREIASIIADLQRPLLPIEAAAGWTKAVKIGYVQVFSDLLEHMNKTGSMPNFGIVRSLDAYGIGSGELYDRMIRVANEANDQLR